ncbi:hypothetical protein NEIMUCOT_06275 [Neisseria mucosa ATCC 25996]|uniref:Uncharacterized protein n=1 Tax=Neisseria mucosa (strain ATCC 25996 / DSM 4631 / NCTC 10774 / M26) TaxID=546266 RepID=D3A039_NEIM2|nr:hypothetical protein NEIMUCOT_06275 [Neisseria mucosa ATCC 25996]
MPIIKRRVMKVFRKSVFWQHYKAGRLNRQVSYFEKQLFD